MRVEGSAPSEMQLWRFCCCCERKCFLLGSMILKEMVDLASDDCMAPLFYLGFPQLTPGATVTPCVAPGHYTLVIACQGLHPPPFHPLGFQCWIACKWRSGLLRDDLFWQILYRLKGIRVVCVALRRSLALCALLKEQPTVHMRVPLGTAPAFTHGPQRVPVFARLMLGWVQAHAVTLGLAWVLGAARP